MKLPFLDKFRRSKGEAPTVVVSAPPTPRIEKAASERLGKTVRPNAARTASAPPFASAPGAPGAELAPPPAPNERAATATIAPPRSEPVAAPKPSAGAERTISLPLAEIMTTIPADLLRSTEIDPEQQILLRATDLERGMATGHPVVLLRTVYQQVPEIFTSDVGAEDNRELPLPFSKVLQQLANLRVCDDEIEAPAPAAAPPQVAATSRAPIRLPSLTSPNDAPPPAAGAATSSPEPLRARPPIALKLPPNGTGAPAIERVPASGGPPVLTPAAPIAPTISTPPIAFKLPPVADAKPAPTQTSEAPAAPASTELCIRLPLAGVLRGVPAIQLSGPIDQVPAEAEIAFPFALIEPQLSLGRIAVTPEQFQDALPPEHRHLFRPEASGTPVPLPLRLVLQNLPNDSLQLRPDQEEHRVSEIVFDTPFGQKAAEDAARLKVSATPISRASATALAGENDDAAPPAPARSALQEALDTDEPLDATAVVEHLSRLPGVSACAIVFSDGLSLAGNIAAEQEAEALCALAPSVLQRINDQLGARFGALEGVTLFCQKTPISFFSHGNICLAALHSAGEIAADIRRRLNRATEELAAIYTQPA